MRATFPARPGGSCCWRWLPSAASAVTREEIVRLSKSGVSDEVILALVDRDKTIFTINPDDLVALKSEGVSEAVVLAMLKSGREEGEAAFAYQAAQAAADRAAVAWIAPNVVVIGHGPDRPNTGYRDPLHVSPRPWSAVRHTVRIVRTRLSRPSGLRCAWPTWRLDRAMPRTST